MVQTFEDYFRGLMHLAEPPDDGKDREGLIDTPKRAGKAFGFLISGYNTRIEDAHNNAIFDAAGNKELVIVKDIEFYSLCEHHMLPFMGHVHVGYIPNEKIIGLSKIPRIVNMYSRRLQIQERLTEEICGCLVEVLDPIGCGVVIEAQHLCMSMRGVMKQNAFMKTSSLRGALRFEPEARSEFIQLVAS